MALVGCRTPTQITVEVTTEVACDGASTKANTTLSVGTLGADLDDKPPVVVTSTCTKVDDKTWRIGSLVLVPSGDKGAEIAIRVVTGINKDPAKCTAADSKDCIIARRSLRFVPHTELYLPIGLDVDCTNVPCDSTTTCVDGKCVGATIPDSSQCTTPNACDEGALPKPGGGSAPGTWKPIKPASAGRVYHRAVWTGTDMVVFGGSLSEGSGYTNRTERYDPKTDTWTSLPDPPLVGRRFSTMFAVGTDVYIFGGEGDLTDGARWDSATNAWTPMKPFPLQGRADFSATYVPTTRELVVWGGTDLAMKTHADGARYSLTTGDWTVMKPTTANARDGASAVWTGTQVVIYGGGCPPGGYCDDTLTYDPVADAWGTIPAPALKHRTDVFGLATGPSSTLATFFGGGLFSNSEANADGATWDGTSWAPIPAIPGTVLADAARISPSVWWDGRLLYEWGGRASTKMYGDGAAYDPSTSTWRALPPAPLGPRQGASVVWTGSSAIVFGGDSNPDIAVDDELADGATFTP